VSIRVTSDAYLTGLARLVNVSAVTSLLNGRVVKGPKREDGTDYPCVTVFISTQDYDPNTTIQLFDAIINIWVAAKKKRHGKPKRNRAYRSSDNPTDRQRELDKRHDTMSSPKLQRDARAI